MPDRPPLHRLLIGLIADTGTITDADLIALHQQYGWSLAVLRRETRLFGWEAEPPEAA